MENLQQIVVQETTSDEVRALAQYGAGIMPEKQIIIIYSELSDDDKAIWDAFVTMIKSK
jgi:hypothetical protein